VDYISYSGCLLISDFCAEDFDKKGLDQATHKPSAGFAV
jgi:hypothetical protein